MRTSLEKKKKKRLLIFNCEIMSGHGLQHPEASTTIPTAKTQSAKFRNSD